jgi:hypothetical protein
MFRDPEITAMGGVNVAIGGTSSAVFHNPAGLSLMKRKYGFEVRALDISGAFSTNIVDFTQDMLDALDKENDTLSAVNKVLNDYMGETFSGEVDTIISLAKRHKSVGWAVGIFGRSALAEAVHQGFGSAGLLDVRSEEFGGVFFGIASDFYEKRLHLGVDVKYVYAGIMDHTFRASELVEHSDDFLDYIKDELVKYGGGLTFDAGVIFTPFPESFLNPAIGFSVMNIPNFKIRDQNGNSTLVIPRTFNVGIAIHPRLLKNSVFLQDCKLGVDLIDITRNFEEDKDWGKRLFMGGEIKLIDHPVFMFALRGGFYQGYPAYGIEVRVFSFYFQAVSYGEEIGGAAGEAENRIYLFNVGIKCFCCSKWCK